MDTLLVVLAVGAAVVLIGWVIYVNVKDDGNPFR